jgi:Patched family
MFIYSIFNTILIFPSFFFFSALHNQSDFVGALNHVQAAVNKLQVDLPIADLSEFGAAIANAAINAYNFSSDNEHTTWMQPAPGGAAFAYSLTFVYYEAYQVLRGVAVMSVLLALGVVYGAGYVSTGSMQVAFATTVVVLCITLDIIGLIWIFNPSGPDEYGLGPYGVDVNPISVVNLIAAVGLAVEFGVHMAAAFSRARGTRIHRATEALIDMGSSVFAGITLTKLVGVTVLALAPSQLFRLYYFRMYLAIIVAGAFHGLAALPVALSLIGWESEAVNDVNTSKLKRSDKEEPLLDDSYDLLNSRGQASYVPENASSSYA